MEFLEKSERRLFQVAYDHYRTPHLFLLVTLFHALRVSEAIGIKGTDVQDNQLSVKRLKKGRATCQPIHRDTDVLFDETPLLAAAANPDRLFNFSRQWADCFIWLGRPAVMRVLRPRFLNRPHTSQSGAEQLPNPWM
jgi:hypothetical protein